MIKTIEIFFLCLCIYIFEISLVQWHTVDWIVHCGIPTWLWQIFFEIDRYEDASQRYLDLLSYLTDSDKVEVSTDSLNLSVNFVDLYVVDQKIKFFDKIEKTVIFRHFKSYFQNCNFTTLLHKIIYLPDICTFNT